MATTFVGVDECDTSVSACEICTNSAEAWAFETLDKISKLWTLVERLNRTVGGERTSVAEPVNSELILVRYVITAALWESEGTSSEEIGGVHDGFHVKASFSAWGLSVGVLLIRLRYCSSHDHFLA